MENDPPPPPPPQPPSSPITRYTCWVIINGISNPSIHSTNLFPLAAKNINTRKEKDRRSKMILLLHRLQSQSMSPDKLFFPLLHFGWMDYVDHIIGYQIGKRSSMAVHLLCLLLLCIGIKYIYIESVVVRWNWYFCIHFGHPNLDWL